MASPEKTPAVARSFPFSEGDWVCSDPQCGNINFARRNVCNRCNKEKADGIASKKKLGHEIGKAAAEKSRGLFSADDWQCNKCGNVNWARRQQCNMCNAPKFGEVEERTGYGGGYNDRGVVEYKDHADSDDDYDEFGRKKKKKSSHRSERSISSSCEVSRTSSPKFNKNGKDIDEQEREKDYEENKEKEDHRNDAEEEEEEEDDDDDDDDDLSKYDLTGWGDDDDEAESKEKTDNQAFTKSSISTSYNSHRSRSRSRSPLHRH